MSIIHRAPRSPRCRPRPSRPKLLPVTCLPWCRWADGHPGLTLTVDQTCTSGHPDLDIGTATVGAYALHRHHGADEYGPADVVAVFLMPHNRGGVELYLTRAQALAAAEQIRSAAELLPEGEVAQ